MTSDPATLSYWRAKRFFDEFREHWGVFVDGHIVDCSPTEYDAELRSCSLCECRDILVTVRHCRPYTTVVGVKRWQIDDLRIYPMDRPDNDSIFD